MGLSIIFQLVSSVLAKGAPARRPPSLYAPAQLEYVRFKVTEDGVAAKLSDWLARDREARTQLEAYLNEAFPSARCATKTFYRMDDDGYLRDVAYNGFVPEGWHAPAHEEKTRHYHWVVPESHQVKYALRQMPQVPSRRELAALVGWPYWETADLAVLPGVEDTSGEGEARVLLLQSANYTLRVNEKEGQVFLDVPVCDNFEAHPEIKDAVGGWAVPGYLVPVKRLLPPRGARFWVRKTDIPAVF